MMQFKFRESMLPHEALAVAFVRNEDGGRTDRLARHARHARVYPNPGELAREHLFLWCGRVINQGPIETYFGYGWAVAVTFAVDMTPAEGAELIRHCRRVDGDDEAVIERLASVVASQRSLQLWRP